MNPISARVRPSGFTLTELLTVMGLITVLLSLFVPVLSKVRAAASNTTCLSNIRQMGAAWTTYMMENHGRLPEYIWYTPATPDLAWKGYWLGILDTNGVRGEALLCPAAREEASEGNRGFGSVNRAWTGRYGTYSGIRRNATSYRTGSYGYNRYLTAGGAFGVNGSRPSCLSAMSNVCNTPAFLDCAYADTMPPKGNESVPAQPPPDLSGASITEGSPQHWRFLLARHGRGINVCMADGSARWVRLEETYQLNWSADWSPYRLRLPNK